MSSMNIFGGFNGLNGIGGGYGAPRIGRPQPQQDLNPFLLLSLLGEGDDNPLAELGLDLGDLGLDNEPSSALSAYPGVSGPARPSASISEAQFDKAFTRLAKGKDDDDTTISKDDLKRQILIGSITGRDVRSAVALQRNFDAIDANKDGKISKDEARVAKAKNGNPIFNIGLTESLKIDGDKFVQIFSTIAGKGKDEDDKTLSKIDLQNAVKELTPNSDEQKVAKALLENFDRIDTSKSGLISGDEAKIGRMKNGKPIFEIPGVVVPAEEDKSDDKKALLLKLLLSGGGGQDLLPLLLLTLLGKDED